MPEIGRPADLSQSQYQQVQMAPRNQNAKNSKDVNSQGLDSKVIEKVTGYREKDKVFQEGPHNQMGKDEFLKLLTFQLKNQDPMNPMEQSKFTSELAQFSQLEQLSNLNAKFDNVNKIQQVQDKFYAASFVGKKVVTTGSSLVLAQDGDSGDVLFSLESNSPKVMIRILDEKNQLIGEIWQDNLSKGSHAVSWDGRSLDGSPAVKGQYSVSVKAWDEFGKEIPTHTQASGIVSSVSFESGEPILKVDGRKVYLRDVESFHVPGGKDIEASNSRLHKQVTPGVKLNDETKQAINKYQQNSESGIYD